MNYFIKKGLLNLGLFLLVVVGLAYVFNPTLPGPLVVKCFIGAIMGGIIGWKFVQ